MVSHNSYHEMGAVGAYKVETQVSTFNILTILLGIILLIEILSVVLVKHVMQTIIIGNCHVFVIKLRFSYYM